MSPSRPAHVPLLDLFSIAVDELDKSINKVTVLNYVPYPEQERFHRSTKVGRYCAGGNRGGKTDAIVVEAIFWAMNIHPYRDRPADWGKGPIQQRFVVVDVSKGIEQIILPKLKRWCASSMLIDGSFDKSWDSKNLIFTFSNGSTIDFLTHGMELDKHGGVPRHIIYFDEEPPQNIFNENMMRLLDYDGWWVIAATPVKGMGWTFDLLWEPAENAGEDLPNKPDLVDIFTLSAEQNPYLKAENFSRFMIGMSAEEKQIRESGKFVARSGLIFPNWRPDTHVIDPFIPPRNWEWYSSVDFGYNNPTAWLWHAVSPRGDIVTFAEHYRDHMVVAEHASIVNLRETSWNRWPDTRVGDPAGNQHTGQTGTSYIEEYAQHGIYIGTEGVPRTVMIGIEKMQAYFRLTNGTAWGDDRPKWVVTSNCVNFIREMRKLRWADYSSDKNSYDMNKKEEVHKKDDHAFDSARYFATMMPDLAGDGNAGMPSKVDKLPTTIPYAEMMLRLRNEEDVKFVDDELSTKWETTESMEDFYSG
jgi:phage terminase large subunit-like protein